MAEIQSISVSQTQNLSISKTISASYERSSSTQASSVSAGVDDVSLLPDGFGKVFDVLDISPYAKRQLLQDRADAEKLAAFAQGQRPQVLKNPLVIDGGKIKVDAAAAEAIERFSFMESYNLSFLEESTVDVKTDEGSFKVTQSRAVEVSLAAAVDILKESNSRFLSTRYGV